jgi:hypothetical protein
MIPAIRNSWRKCKGRTVNKKVSPHDRLPVSRGRPAAALLAAISALLAAPAYGQGGPALSQTFVQQQRQIEEQIRQQFGEYLPPSQTWQFDAGDWQSFYFLNFDDGVRRRTMRLWDNRPWIAGTGDWGTHQFYARLKMTYTDWNHGDSYNGDEDDFDGPDADRLWYQFDLGQAAKVYGKTNLPFGFQAKVGRQYVEFGSGYTLSLPLDAVLLSTQVNNVEVRGLISKTIKGMDDIIDPSRPDSHEMDRHLLGVEARYRGRQHTPFAFVLWDLDENPRSYFPGGQAHGYDSFYTGIGSMGQLAHNLRYSTEIVYEGGRSYGNGVMYGRDPINALGFDALIDYLIPNKYQPDFQLEYMFASGDGDRRGSPISAVGGNTSGVDSSFIAFGYRDTGMAFAPLLTNINIWRAGASVLPFTNRGALRRLRVGTDWFLYAKNKATGAVSDFTADRPDSYLGWEMDYYVNYQITEELATTARCGVFFPGDAFSDRDSRSFFLLGVTYSF